MIKVTVQQELPPPAEIPSGQSYWETTNEIRSEDQIVIAKFLRALADRLDPPKAQTRSTNPLADFFTTIKE